MMRSLTNPIGALATTGAVIIGFAVGLAALPTRAADHLDAPLVALDGRTDINDVYAFRSPANSANTVLIMTVNPAAGVFTNSPTTFHPNASYEFLIDGNGDAKPDTKIEIEFGKVKNGKQEVELELEGPGGEAEAEGKTGRDIQIDINGEDNDDRGEDNDDEGEENDNEGGGMLHAGLFDDPFFFDLAAFNAGGAFCPGGPGSGTNFFNGLNVSAIVVEVPSSLLGDNTIGVWARTVMGGNQIDRMGRPAINTVFIPPNPFEKSTSSPPDLAMSEDAFNATKPKNDAMWTAEVVDTLLFLSSLDGSAYTPARAAEIAGVLLPDILTIDTSSPAGFVTGPLNGRQLADDVIDLELFVVTGGFVAGGTAAITTDCVANDSNFNPMFPYLASPNPANP